MDRNGLSNFANVISKFSKTSPHNHHRNTRKSRFMTITLFRQKTKQTMQLPNNLRWKTCAWWICEVPSFQWIFCFNFQLSCLWY